MRRVIVLPDAKQDLNDIHTYRSDYSVEFADELLDRLTAQIRRCARHPGLGRCRDELVPGIRSFVLENYLIFYNVFDDRIEVVRVVHGSRNLAQLFRDDSP